MKQPVEPTLEEQMELMEEVVGELIAYMTAALHDITLVVKGPEDGKEEAAERLDEILALLRDRTGIYLGDAEEPGEEAETE